MAKSRGSSVTSSPMTEWKLMENLFYVFQLTWTIKLPKLNLMDLLNRIISPTLYP